MAESGSLLVGVRPEHVRLDPAASLRGTVTLVEHLGHETLVNAHVGETKVVVRQPASAATPGIGDEVGIDLPEAHRHRFDLVTERRVA